MSAERRVILDDPFFDPALRDQEGYVKFHLTYAGPLKSNGTAYEKHLLRKHFHKQLKALWEYERVLKWRLQPGNGRPPGDQRSWAEAWGDNYACAGFRWVPLVRGSNDYLMSCRIDILMLRLGIPGGAIQSADIDARLKTLFDGLRRADKVEEVGGCKPEPGEDPFFVLLEDDRLITAVSVETDNLLEPINADPVNVRLVLTVEVLPMLRSEGYP